MNIHKINSHLHHSFLEEIKIVIKRSTEIIKEGKRQIHIEFLSLLIISKIQINSFN